MITSPGSRILKEIHAGWGVGPSNPLFLRFLIILSVFCQYGSVTRDPTHNESAFALPYRKKGANHG